MTLMDCWREKKLGDWHDAEDWAVAALEDFWAKGM